MSEVTAASPRRSSRVFHKMRVQAHGRGHNGKKFRETCETLVVNGYGGLLLLKHEIDNGEMLVITNPETLEEQECRVVYLGEPGDKQRSEEHTSELQSRQYLVCRLLLEKVKSMR